MNQAKVTQLELQVQQMEARIEDAMKQAAEIGVTHYRPRPQKFLEELHTEYPYGEEHNFGISISGAVVTILRGTTKRGRAAYAIGAASVTITEDMQWVAIKMTAGTGVGDDTFAYGVYADRPGPPDDDGALSVLALHQFRLVDGKAIWHFSTHCDGNFTGMGH